MWRAGWMAFALIALAACKPMVDTRVHTTEEFESTYAPGVHEYFPPGAGGGDAPLAGSLGPPEHMVEPVMPGTTTTTSAGSSGPPIRSDTGGAKEPVGQEPAPGGREYLRGHDPDAY